MRLALLASLALSFLSLTCAHDQIPLGAPDMAEAEPYTDAEPYTPLTHTQPTLADLLTIEPAASIFYAYARELALVAQFADAAARCTLLVPTNKAVMALARKPHEGPAPPADTGVVITEEERDARSRRNVARWVSAHIIPQSPIALAPGTHATLLAGKNVTLRAAAHAPDAPEWARVALDDGIRIIAAKQAVNGVVYMIDDTVKLD